MASTSLSGSSASTSASDFSASTSGSDSSASTSASDFSASTSGSDSSASTSAPDSSASTSASDSSVSTSAPDSSASTSGSDSSASTSLSVTSAPDSSASTSGSDSSVSTSASTSGSDSSVSDIGPFVSSCPIGLSVLLYSTFLALLKGSSCPSYSSIGIFLFVVFEEFSIEEFSIILSLLLLLYSLPVEFNCISFNLLYNGCTFSIFLFISIFVLIIFSLDIILKKSSTPSIVK